MHSRALLSVLFPLSLAKLTHDTHSLAFVQCGRGLGGGYRGDPSPRVAENGGQPRRVDEYDTLGYTSLARVACAKRIRPRSLPDKEASIQFSRNDDEMTTTKDPAFQ